MRLNYDTEALKECPSSTFKESMSLRLPTAKSYTYMYINAAINTKQCYEGWKVCSKVDSQKLECKDVL